VKSLSPRAQELLRAARAADVPTAADKARIKAQLDARLADPHLAEPDLGSEPSATTGGSTAWTSAAKWSAAAAAGAAAVWLATGPSAPTAEAPGLVEPVRGPDALRIEQVRPIAPPPEAGSTSEPDVGSPRWARVGDEPEPAPDAAPSVSAARLAAEAALVREAQGAVRDGDWARALRLTARHRAEFPAGALGEERYALEIIAACRAGDAEREAQARRELRAAHPDSVHWDRVERACRAR
jgi:hypothetical protein